MGRFGLGLRILFRILGDAEFAERVRQLDAGEVAPESKRQTEPKAEARELKVARRSEAITLLAALQREARFVDFIKEPIAAFSDAQVGAAVRDIHKNCGGVIERFFALEPLAPAAEGEPIEVPRGFDPAQFRLTGNLGKEAPFHGTVCHHGWKAMKCELPEWTGSETASRVIAPTEVEVK